MIGEIYVTINDLREENKLLRKERNEFVKEIDHLHSQHQRIQEECDVSDIKIIQKDCMITRIQKNYDILERLYHEKCIEYQKYQENELKLQQQWNCLLQQEKLKRKAMNKKLILLQDVIEVNQRNQQQQLLSNPMSPPHSNSSTQTNCIESSTIMPIFDLDSSISSQVVDVLDNSTTATSQITSSINQTDNYHLQTTITTTEEKKSQSSVLLPAESNEDIIQLISEKNYWKNQAVSLRKELLFLSSHLPSQSECQHCRKLLNLNEELNQQLESLISDIEIYLGDNDFNSHNNENNKHNDDSNQQPRNSFWWMLSWVCV